MLQLLAGNGGDPIHVDASKYLAHAVEITYFNRDLKVDILLAT